MEGFRGTFGNHRRFDRDEDPEVYVDSPVDKTGTVTVRHLRPRSSDIGRAQN